MKLIIPSYEILTPINGEQIIIDMEKAARTCYKSEGNIEIQVYPKLKGCDDERILAASGRKLVTKLIKRGHHAMLEFGQDITVKFTVDRGVSHELVRHRLASFAQESTRYVNYVSTDIQFIIPPWVKIPPGDYHMTMDPLAYYVSYSDEIKKFDDSVSAWLYTMANAERTYNHLIEQNEWSPQQARSVLPNSLKTEINVKANLREWRHIFKLRVAKAAHPQMQEIMRPLLDEFKNRIPIIFDDINY